MALTDGQLSPQETAVRTYSDKAALYDFLFHHVLGIGTAVRSFVHHANLVSSGHKVLDAGCGSGLVTKALFQQAKRRAISNVTYHGFDVSPKMLARFETWTMKLGSDAISTQEANVLDLSALPHDWIEYDLIVSCAMLEQVSRDDFAEAINNLRARLKKDGRLFLFVTRRTMITKWIFDRLWLSNLYSAEEVLDGLAEAGLSSAQFHGFQGPLRPFTQWILIAEASSQA